LYNSSYINVVIVVDNSSSSSWSHAEDYKWYNDADLNFVLIEKKAIDLPTTKMLKHKTKSIKTLSKNTR